MDGSTAQLTPCAAFSPLLVLYGPDGTPLVQSSGASLVQELTPGNYRLAVSSQGGSGSYRLTTQFVSTDTPSPDATQLAVSPNAGLPLDPLTVGNSPQAVTAADVNGDGKLDLIVANSADSTISVLLGNGDGSFLPQNTIHVGNSPQAVAVADLNGDGKLDLIVANTADNTIGVLLGNGDGTFQPQQTTNVGGGRLPSSSPT